MPGQKRGWWLPIDIIAGPTGETKCAHCSLMFNEVNQDTINHLVNHHGFKTNLV